MDGDTVSVITMATNEVITIIDATTFDVLGTVPSGLNPEQFDVHLGGDRLCVLVLDSVFTV